MLGDTSLPTASALERSEVLVQIMVNITGGETEVMADKIVKFCSSVSSEEEQLKSLKHVLGTQVSETWVRKKNTVLHSSSSSSSGNSKAYLRVSAEAEKTGEEPRHEPQEDRGGGRT